MSGSPWLSLSVFYTYGCIQMNAAGVQASLLQNLRINQYLIICKNYDYSKKETGQ
jgi:hypothetical protein